jgi:hypothetical protein
VLDRVLKLMAGCGVALTPPSSGSDRVARSLPALDKVMDGRAFVVTGNPEY